MFFFFFFFFFLDKIYPCALNLGANIGKTPVEKKTMVAMLSVDVKLTKDSLFGASHLLAIRNLDGFLARKYEDGSKYYRHHCFRCMDNFKEKWQRDR